MYDKTWTKEKHVAKHEELHTKLDELVADYIFHTGFTPSQKTIGDLMQWSFNQMKYPTEKE